MNNTKITPFEKDNAQKLFDVLVGKNFTTAQISNVLLAMGSLLMAKAVIEEAEMQNHSAAAGMQ